MADMHDDDGLIRPRQRPAPARTSNVVRLPTNESDDLILPGVIDHGAVVRTVAAPAAGLDVLNDPAILQILDFLRTNEGSTLSSGVVGAALDQLPVEDALAYLVQIGEASSEKAKWIAQSGGLVDGSMDAKLAGLNFIVDRVLNLPVLEGERRVTLARQQGELAVLKHTAGSNLLVAGNTAEQRVIESQGQVGLSQHSVDQKLIESSGQLAQAKSQSTIDDAKRLVAEKQTLGEIGHQQAMGEITHELKSAEIRATKEVYVPVKTGLSARQAKLQAKREAHAMHKQEASFIREKYGWIIVAVIVLIVAANLVCDVPGQESFPLLGWINQLWDAIYMPLRNGVMHTLGKSTS